MKESLLENYRKALSPTRPAPYIAVADRFLKWLGDREFTKENVQKWLKHLAKEGFADGTIHTNFDIALRLAKVNGIHLDFLRHERPIVREREQYRPTFDPADIETMVKCVRGLKATPVEVKPQHAAFLALSTVYGLRRIEMVEIEPSSLDIANKTIFIQTAKKGRQRFHLVPDNILEYLEAWGFWQKASRTYVSNLFNDLKQMIGYQQAPDEEVGWHSIRRSAVDEAYNCGLSEPAIYDFYRWKPPTRNMPLRYATGRRVGTHAQHAIVAFGDRRFDEEVFEKHPFVRFWD